MPIYNSDEHEIMKSDATLIDHAIRVSDGTLYLSNARVIYERKGKKKEKRRKRKGKEKRRGEKKEERKREEGEERGRRRRGRERGKEKRERKREEGVD